MSEGAVRDDMTLKMTAEREHVARRSSERSRRLDENFHTPDFGLTAIFNLPYFTRELGNAVFRSRPTLVHIMCHGLGLPPDFFLR
jgi:hypothetical protein